MPQRKSAAQRKAHGEPTKRKGEQRVREAAHTEQPPTVREGDRSPEAERRKEADRASQEGEEP